MPIPSVAFENNYLVAQAVSRYIDNLRPSPQGFTLRPYQYQAPSFTEWWLVPSTEWPAYHHSKLCVHRVAVDGEEYLYTGFYVEQGLHDVLKGEPDVKPSLVMQNDWYWHKFLQHAKAGSLEPALRQLLERSECPVVVWLDAYAFNRVPEREGEAHLVEEDKPQHDDAIEFVVRRQDMRFELSKQANHVLSPLNNCTDLSQLAQRLETLQELHWFWINLLIGIRLRYGARSTGDWGAAEIWRNALQPWMPWVH